MPEYKEYALVGGQPVKIVPFDASGASEGAHFAPAGAAFNPVIVGSGGGNPNFVETITGTMADPWGELDYAELVQDVGNNDATATLAVPSMNLVAYLISNQSELSLNGANFISAGDDMTLAVAAFAKYGADGALNVILMWQNGTAMDVTSMLSGAETTLTVIHHPLPDGSIPLFDLDEG